MCSLCPRGNSADGIGVFLRNDGVDLTLDVVESVDSEAVDLSAFPVHLMLVIFHHVFSERC